jgi:hypothetical protein
MPRVVVRLLVGLAVLVGVSPALAQFCPPAADPCVIASSVNVAGGTIIDVGTRDLVIGPSVTLTVLGSGTGALNIVAGDVTFEQGARIVAGGVDGSGGALTMVVGGTLLMRTNSRIDVVGGSGGDVTITAVDAVLQGQIVANGTNSLGDGGFVDINTSGSLSIGGTGIQVNGGNGDSFGGFVFFTTGGLLEVGAAIQVRGGSGGDSDFDAGGDLRILAGGSVNNIALFAGNDGGDVSFAAGGAVSIAGTVLSRGQGSMNEGGGFGGDVDVLAGTDVTIDGQIEITGAGPDGDGGFLDVSADGNILVRAPILATGAAQGGGGEVDLFARGRIDVQGAIDLRGGFVGGVFDVQAAGPVVFTAAGDIAADFIPGFVLGGYGGIILIDGCDVTVPTGAVLTTQGIGTAPRAVTRLRAGNTTTIGGTLQGGNAVALSHRGTVPTILGSAVIQPAPTITLDPLIPCCVLCSTTTSTSTSSSTSTTSTSVSTTSTSLPASTTSTTIIVPTTTSSSSSTSSSVASTSTTTSTTSSTSTSTSSSTTSSSSSTTSTSSSTVSTTVTSTTSTTATSETTTTTSTSSSSSTMAPSTTVTTTTVASTTTSTSLPPTCLDEPLQGYAALQCAIGELSDTLAAQTPEALGGKRSAKNLARKIVKIDLLVARSETARRPDKLLARAQRKVSGFEIQLAKLLAKDKIAENLVEELLALSTEVTQRLDGVLAPLN